MSPVRINEDTIAWQTWILQSKRSSVPTGLLEQLRSPDDANQAAGQARLGEQFPYSLHQLEQDWHDREENMRAVWAKVIFKVVSTQGPSTLPASPEAEMQLVSFTVPHGVIFELLSASMEPIPP
jgi:hypothetical protein